MIRLEIQIIVVRTVHVNSYAYAPWIATYTCIASYVVTITFNMFCSTPFRYSAHQAVEM